MMSDRTARALWLGLLAAVSTVGVSGCTVFEVQPVQPWQRGDLARAEMALEVDPLLSGFRQHVEVSKEAARGGTALAGGGCGCN
ncbi:DUF4266 domain-containing protein [Sinimarinibacterium sp. NLF-5-8]|uniref:DUF4266 domain-containing protein n=1 Tax=Sinimarinibacterium sp. NLF-5-8 TaxID=2698684 RepID=UPI00137C325F|nr:DUF4266 domain-containing protein [Sinimarinibacterium sp. NLF-5-8]QHS10805.1 DUF4266 domain-containing protein [Sinimarinibacterium sp. NLF-5-8]